MQKNAVGNQTKQSFQRLQPVKLGGVENLSKRIKRINDTNDDHFKTLTEIQKTLQQLDENFGEEFQEMENCKQENFELLKNLLHV